MHEYGIHCYNPTKKAVALINTVSRNKQGFSKRKINSAYQAKNLTPNLGIYQLNISGGLFKYHKS